MNVEKLTISTKGNYLYEDKAICRATHPDKPNRSGLARGRSIHLTKDGKKTLCNMLTDGYFTDTFFIGKKECKICFK